MSNISKYSPRYNNDIYLYTKGGEFSLNGKNYIGEYHLEGTVAKTGPVSTSDSMTLHRLYNNPDHYAYDKVFNFNVPVLKFIEPVPHLYRPQEQVYSTGFDARYFVEKFEDENSYAIEIDSSQYKLIGKEGGIDGGLYRYATLQWKLTGRREDIMRHNELELYKASAILPSVSYAVKNFLEFARITLV